MDKQTLLITCEKLRSLLSESAATEYSFELQESEKQELNSENETFSLFRTTFDHSASVRVLLGEKKGSVSGNDLTEEGLKKLVSEAVLAAESASPESANGFAEKQEDLDICRGAAKADMPAFYDRLQELLSSVRAEFPKVKMAQIIADHTLTHSIYENSSGTHFEEQTGCYGVMLEFAGNSGEETTGFCYVYATTKDLDRPILDLSDFREQMRSAELQLVPAKIPGKFEGNIILTPGAVAEFLMMLLSNYASDQVILEETSQWLDRVGEKVAHEGLTVYLKSDDDRLTAPDLYTSDGYRAENVTILEKGVLKTHILNLFTAKKTGRPVTKNESGNLVMEPGSQPYSDMLKGLKKGLLVGGFSGGQPGANGEFSGVAKNAFYVEDGQIRGAVSETMISGNLESLFQNIVAISREVVTEGQMVLPYMEASGVTISGK